MWKTPIAKRTSVHPQTQGHSAQKPEKILAQKPWSFSLGTLLVSEAFHSLFASGSAPSNITIAQTKVYPQAPSFAQGPTIFGIGAPSNTYRTPRLGF